MLTHEERPTGTGRGGVDVGRAWVGAWAWWCVTQVQCCYCYCCFVCLPYAVTVHATPIFWFTLLCLHCGIAGVDTLMGKLRPVLSVRRVSAGMRWVAPNITACFRAWP